MITTNMVTLKINQDKEQKHTVGFVNSCKTKVNRKKMPKTFENKSFFLKPKSGRKWKFAHGGNLGRWVRKSYWFFPKMPPWVRTGCSSKTRNFDFEFFQGLRKTNEVESIWSQDNFSRSFKLAGSQSWVYWHFANLRTGFSANVEYFINKNYFQ